MKRPLLPTTRSSDDASLEAEEQIRLEQNRQEGKGLVWQVFLLGSVVGLALQGMAIATGWTISKIWGQKPTYSSSFSLLSYWIFLSIQVCIAIYNVIVLILLCTRTKWGSLYTRKQVDQDAHTPAGSNSIWKARMLFVVRNDFLFGFIVGTFSFYAIVDLPIAGMTAPSKRLLMASFVVQFALSKCFDWGHTKSAREEQEEEVEEDGFFFNE
jgi:hypothetical protein